MSSSRDSRFKLYFFYFCIIALLCDGFFSYFLRGPLTIWRQLLLLGCWGVFFAYPKQYLGRAGKTFLLFIYALLAWFVLRAGLTYVELGFNPIRLGYALFIFFGAIPFFILPTIVLRSGKDPTSIFRFFALLGGFFGGGLIIDGISGGYFLFLKEDLLYSVGADLDDVFRYSFLAQLISTFGCISFLSVISSLYMVSIKRTIFSQGFYLLCALLVCIGGWFSGSRQIVYPAFLIFFTGILFYFIVGRGKKFLIGASTLLGVAFLSLPIYEFLVKTSDKDEMTERFTLEAIAQDTRYLTWKAGWNETVGDPVVFFMGNGVAYTMGQQARGAEVVGSHYENTFFTVISNAGIFGVVLFLLPVFFILWRIWTRSGPLVFFDFLSIFFIGGFLLTSIASPNGITPTAQIAIYVLAGIYNHRDQFLAGGVRFHLKGGGTIRCRRISEIF